MRFLPKLVLLILVWLPAFPAAAGDLIIGVRQFPTSLHPLFDPSVAKSVVLGMVIRPITAHDHDWNLTCLMCAELPSVDAPESHPNVIRLSLKPGLTWADGTQISADDVLFTWQVGRNPESNVVNSELFRHITQIDVVDDKTVLLHVDNLTYQFANLNDFILLPAHIEAAVFHANPKDYRQATNFIRSPQLSSLYNGPYVVSSVVSGSHIILARNPHWTGKRPAFDRVIIRAIEDTSALMTNLLSGDIDMIPGEAGLTVDQAESLGRRYPARFDIVYKLGLNFEHIDLNLDNETLKDGRIRRALLYALDRESIVRSLFAGRHQVANSSVGPLDRFYADDGSNISFDPVLASNLLDQAGWIMAGNGIRRNASGQPLRLEILSIAGNHARNMVLQVLKDQWLAVGIELSVRDLPARVFFEELSKRRFTMALYAFVTSPEWLPRPTLHSSRIPSESNGWTGYNYSGYRDAAMDRLIDAIDVELDPGRRGELWRQLQRRFADQLPVLPLYFYATAYITPPWLKGVEPTGHNSFATLWIENWTDARQK